MKKIMSIILTITVLITMIAIPTHAVENDVVKEIEANFKESFFSLQTQIQRTYEIEKEAIGLYDKLVKQISVDISSAATDNRIITTYPENYGGAYLHEDGSLVICATADRTSENLLNLEEIYKTTDRYKVETVQFSLNQLKTAHSELLDCLLEYASLYSPDSAEYGLFSSIVGMGTNQMDNTVYVQMKNVTDEKLQLFDEIFGDNADIFSITEVGGTAPTLTLRPGSKLLLGSSGTSYGSIGFRASFTDDNDNTYYGFTTAGHCLDEDDAAYFAYGSSRVEIGTAIVSMMTGSVDGCFVGLTNSSYNMGNVAAYSNDTGGEDDAPTISATYYTGSNSLLSNSTIYKVGATTFFTAGQYLSDDHVSTYGDTVYLTNMLTHSALTLGGDSGGCVFTYRNNQNVILGVTSGNIYRTNGSPSNANDFLEGICSQARYMVPNLGITLY